MHCSLLKSQIQDSNTIEMISCFPLLDVLIQSSPSLHAFSLSYSRPTRWYKTSFPITPRERDCNSLPFVEDALILFNNKPLYLVRDNAHFSFDKCISRMLFPDSINFSCTQQPQISNLIQSIRLQHRGEPPKAPYNHEKCPAATPSTQNPSSPT